MLLPNLRSARRAALLAVCALLAHLVLTASVARAHPLSQGALEVVVHPDHVSVRARVTVEEVIITDLTTTPLTPDAPAASTGEPVAKLSFEATYARHARYL